MVIRRPADRGDDRRSGRLCGSGLGGHVDHDARAHDLGLYGRLSGSQRGFAGVSGCRRWQGAWPITSRRCEEITALTGLEPIEKAERDELNEIWRQSPESDQAVVEVVSLELAAFVGAIVLLTARDPLFLVLEALTIFRAEALFRRRVALGWLEQAGHGSLRRPPLAPYAFRAQAQLCGRARQSRGRSIGRYPLYAAKSADVLGNG